MEEAFLPSNTRYIQTKVRKPFILKQNAEGVFWLCNILSFIKFGPICSLFMQLVDMSQKLWQVYNRLDPVSLESLLTEVKFSFILHDDASIYNALLNLT